MADGLNETAAPELAPVAHAPQPSRPPALYRGRFALAYLALAAVLGAAVGLLVVFLGTDAGGKSEAWSEWKPAENGVKRFEEIGKHVSRGYATIAGRQLVGVISAPPHVQSQAERLPVQAIVVSSGLLGETEKDVDVVSADHAWTYILCGGGQACAINDGQPSVARYQLLQREALELALYTFKYVDDADGVLVYMPPAVSTQTSSREPVLRTIFLRRSDLHEALSKPLSETLATPKTRLVPGGMGQKDLALVQKYTNSRIFDFEFQQSQIGGAILVLRPVS